MKVRFFRNNRRGKNGSPIALLIVLVIVIAGFSIWYFGIEKHTFKDLVTLVSSRFTVGDNNNENENINTFENLSETRLTVHIIDVGQGDSILITFPDNKEMLIDCGNYNNYSTIKEGTLNYLREYVTDGQIDYLMLTHCDSDHVYFLDEVLDEYDVDNIYIPNVLAVPENEEKADVVNSLNEDKLNMFTDEDTVSTACYADFFIAALSEENANIYLNQGEFSIEGNDYSLSFYAYNAQEWGETDLSSSEEKNAICPIGILQYQGIKVVLTGDSNEINEPYFMEKVGTSIDCDVLKVAHHGSETSSTEDFLDFIDPEYAVISCNKEGNDFNHPRAETLKRLTDRDMTVYRTDINGTVVFAVDSEGKLAFLLEKEPK